ncbi:M1 family metallopeptidase [Streptomyces sp. NPDC059740]|uniref:M1 family metallopeptidase n=1 Tax=Streptomyces sp. NPDC059740 TaxID=3346926 RepID=UPI00364EBE31
MSFFRRPPQVGPTAPPAGAPAVPRPAGRRAAARTRSALAAGATTVALVAAASPPPGAAGIGDRLFPTLGNPGYDVLSYDVSLRYSGANDRPLDATTRLTARVTDRLDHLNLDFARGTVRSVEVDGAPARFHRDGEDLVLRPSRPLWPGELAQVTVHHTSDPTGPKDASDGGWVRTSDGLAMANQADAAHRVFPCNDHPSDKAYFTFHVTAPKELTVVAGGTPFAERHPHGDATTWTYRTAHPMATELAQVSIGHSAVVRREGPHGLPLRDVVPTADRARLEPWLAKTPEQVRWMEARVGRFPFETYGVLMAHARTGFELETQTLSLFERDLFTTKLRIPEGYLDSIMVHELAHQWFGDSVSPRRWSDVWLNEGHATWYEALYAQEKAHAPMETRMRNAYRMSDAWRADGGPPAAPRAPEPGKKVSIFRPSVYDGSALVLYALRTRIGADAFGRLERLWVARHRDGVADTADFVHLASEVSGADQSAFLHHWLFDAKTPPMPGHPDWHAQAPAKAPRAATRAARPAEAVRSRAAGGPQHGRP